MEIENGEGMSVVLDASGIGRYGAGGFAKAAGTVTDVFGHWFTVQTSDGKILADLGPKECEVIVVAPAGASTKFGTRSIWDK